MKVLVIGDSCLDVFHYGECFRLCPEAPVPVFSPKYSQTDYGMAWNVKRNFDAIEVECDIITNEPTITKTRYVDDKTNQMLLRVDENDTTNERFDRFGFLEVKDDYTAVVVADYNKGYLTEKDIEFIGKNHPLTFLDTKKIIDSWAETITYIKINNFEHERTKHTLYNALQDKLIVTRGENGCVYLDKKIPVPRRVPVIDVVGAGDAFMAGLVSQYMVTEDIYNAIDYAQECATSVVQKRGVNTI